MSSNKATSSCHPERRPSLCYHEQRRFFVILNELFLTVILNEAAGGVKDLGHDNVPEMCFPDSSLTLRMTEGAFRMTERTLRMTCKGCYAGHFAKRHHLHLHIAVMVGEHFRACEGHFCLKGIMMLCRGISRSGIICADELS